MTPPEITRVGTDGAWDLRVIPNRYPALVPGETPERRGDRVAREMAGVGWHEVVVESPHHDERMEDMPVDRVAAVLGTWRARHEFLATEDDVRAVVVFKNFGEAAGTSLVHPHSQVVAIPVLSPDDLHRYAVAARYHDDTGHCVYVDLLEHELRERDRVVAEREGFVAITPFASRVPFETWIFPRRRATSFRHVDPSELPALAELIRDVVGGVRRAAGDPDYNLVVHSAPVSEESKPYFLWHLRVLPRIDTPAGFELGTGMSINTVGPETAADLLREALAAAPLA
jgi:UDPglucose--hexose-1-phosphate uridylyltransferase